MTNPPKTTPAKPSAPLALHLLTAVVAAAGGALAWFLHIPLPWMLGAMAATGALAWNDRAAVSAPVRPIALLALGLGLGQTFTTPVLHALALALPWLIVAALVSIVVGALVARLFARMAGTDPRTGYFSAVPGGVIVMAVLAQRYGVSVPAVSLAQTIRVMVVVVIFPALITWLVPYLDTSGAGAFIIERPPIYVPGLVLMFVAGVGVALLIRMLKLANPWMLGPCALVILLSAFEVLPSGVPLWMINVAQIGMGAGLGQRMNKRFLLASRRLALASVASTFILSAILAALAVGLGLLSGLPLTAVALGMAPGGMPEMTITAKALGLAVPLVLGFHLVRTVSCNLLVGPVWRMAERLGLDR